LKIAQEVGPLMDKEAGRAGGAAGAGCRRRLLKASLLMAFYTGSERKAVPLAVSHHLLFRFDHSTFSKNRARLM
jgi:hypothetical protein